MSGAARCPEGISCGPAINTSVSFISRYDASHLGLDGPVFCSLSEDVKVWIFEGGIGYI